MKKRKSLCLIMLSWTVLNLSCTSLLVASPPKLKDRRLRICDEKPGLCYGYQTCTKWRRSLFGKKKCETFGWQVDYYNFQEIKTRELLINIGFSCTASGRWAK